mmetsp:Transcript_11393/g.28867  ORF Transcript_11393/g.28867 Transcript_11393/m.28867 type:complete len:223 (+) Transcript_11393:1007-1675(+)
MLKAQRRLEVFLLLALRLALLCFGANLRLLFGDRLCHVRRRRASHGCGVESDEAAVQCTKVSIVAGGHGRTASECAPVEQRRDSNVLQEPLFDEHVAANTPLHLYELQSLPLVQCREARLGRDVFERQSVKLAAASVVPCLCSPKKLFLKAWWQWWWWLVRGCGCVRTSSCYLEDMCGHRDIPLDERKRDLLCPYLLRLRGRDICCYCCWCCCCCWWWCLRF